MPIIKFDYDLCINCETCVEECPIRLLVSEDSRTQPRGDRVEGKKKSGSVVAYNAPGCSNCRTCMISCPVEGAIIIEIVKDKE